MKFKIAFFFVATFILFLLTPQKIFAVTWSYPLDRFGERPSLKGFGQLIDEKFYVGKENLFPNKFYGYHTGVDLEIFPEEQNENVPVFAVSSGTIAFVGPISGYGSVILEKLDGENLTALYGHLKLKSTSLKTGDSISAGDKLALLGNAFTNETDGERKHLHFGIYKGSGLYFKGYEQNLQQLETKWINPAEFFKARITIIPTLEPITPTPEPSSASEKTPNIFFSLINLLKRILGLKE